MIKKNVKILLLNISIPIIAFILSMLISSFIILCIGGSPLNVFKTIVKESLTSGYGLGQVLQKTTQLIFTGLAVAIAFRCGLFNMGAEGQLIIGSLFIGIAGTIDYGLPAVLTILFCITAGIIGGGLWGALPGFLKARYGAHEVITTIMLNFIAFALVNWIIEIPGIAPKETVHTYPIIEKAVLLKLSTLFPFFAGSTVNISFVLSIFIAIGVWIFLNKTTWGYELRATGLNPNAAETYGISTKKMIIFSMALSGAIASLVGADFVLGYKNYFELDFSAGIGFMGIAVALLAGNNPIAVVPAAFLFGILSYGKITLGTEVPKEIIEIIQAVVIILVALFTVVGRKMIRTIE